jgi:hypothetical protein
MPTPTPSRSQLRRLIATAMDLERRTMQLYCLFESQFAASEELRAFWFDMARHESRHFGGLALVGGLLEGASGRPLGTIPPVTGRRVQHLKRLLTRFEGEAARGVTLERALEMALEVEGSEIEDLVLGLLAGLRGEADRARAVNLLLHDLGDLSLMIEKHTSDQRLLRRADQLLERQIGRLRNSAARGVRTAQRSASAARAARRS